MSSTSVIDPVTGIEGHSKITIQLDDQGEVVDAQFHITQFRGLERIVQGRPIHEMPSIMARIHGICPVSHLIASAKACDQILAVVPPPTGIDLRKVLNLAQIVQSNALSFFHLSSPDLLFGSEADPAHRNIIGLARAHPQLARDGVGVRQFGQQIIEWLGGKRIHPGWIVPGGVDAPLLADTRDRILSTIPEAIAGIERALAWYKSSLIQWEDEAASFGGFRSAFMGLVGHDGNIEHYDGLLRVIDADGTDLADRIDPTTYANYLGEAVEPWSHLTSTYWKTIGYPDGVYRVGPLARIIVASQLGTPRADLELADSGAFPAAPSTTTTPGSSTRSTPPSGSSSSSVGLTSSRHACAPTPGSTATRESAFPRHLVARCFITTRSMTTGSSSGRTSWLPPGTTTWP